MDGSKVHAKFHAEISEMCVFSWNVYILHVQSRCCAYILYMYSYVYFSRIEISYFGRNSTIATVRNVLTPYRVTHLQRYEVTLRGNVTSVSPPLYSARPLSWGALIVLTELIKNACPTI